MQIHYIYVLISEASWKVVGFFSHPGGKDGLFMEKLNIFSFHSKTGNVFVFDEKLKNKILQRQILFVGGKSFS